MPARPSVVPEAGYGATLSGNIYYIERSQDWGADESRWASRTSNPLGGIDDVFGGFDSHALPPARLEGRFNSGKTPLS